MNAIVVNNGQIRFRPLDDRVLVRRIPDVSVGMIIVPDIAQQNSQRAVVEALGKKCQGFEIGDIVLLPGIAAKYPDWEDCDYMLVQQGDIGGVFS